MGESRGQAMVEFVLVLPALMLILLGIVQFGVVFKQYLTLTDAVREGARKAAVARHYTGSKEGYVKSEVVKSGSDLGAGFTTSNVQVTSPWTPGSDVVVRATFDFDIDVLGRVVYSGDMTSTATERVE
jgi:Flp pilus assembly protein TadG